MLGHVRVKATAVTRRSDGRRFYLVELGGTDDEPRHVSCVDRDQECVCDGCGDPIEPGSTVLAMRVVGGGQLMFHASPVKDCTADVPRAGA